MYLVRWQLSTPILAVCVHYLANLGYIWSTIIANFIGGLIFFWVDRFIFYHKIKFPIWEVKDSVICSDCGQIVSRGYRLVQATGYDRLNDENPQFRCEKCSILKFEAMRVNNKI
jgi:DNA-directed RNA polymerase subunit RPC12/RpoP